MVFRFTSIIRTTAAIKMMYLYSVLIVLLWIVVFAFVLRIPKVYDPNRPALATAITFVISYVTWVIADTLHHMLGR
jgi:hypothetical protein